MWDWRIPRGYPANSREAIPMTEGIFDLELFITGGYSFTDYIHPINHSTAET